MKNLILLIALFTTAHANATYKCSERRAAGFVRSICNGIVIPVDKTRNFNESNHKLECTVSSDNFIRRPQKFDYNRWATLTASDDPSMVKLANQERRDPSVIPDIKWSGRIPYETMETWSWENCEYHTNGAECGYDRVCNTVTDRVCNKDANGVETCNNVSREECHDEPRSCWYDVTYNEAIHCSNEVMNYRASFSRPTYAQWNPEKDGKVAEVLPNKYDLLPGEIENIQTFTNGSRSAIIRPNAKVVNNWNDYSIRYGGNAVGAQCRQNQTLDLVVQVDTVGRKIGKKSPNAFRMPVDMEGHALDPFQDSWAMGTDRKTGKPVKLRPQKLMLADSASAMIGSISEISRKATAREVRKVNEGRAGNRDASTLGNKADPLSQSFFKNTVVRIELYKKNRWWWDSRASLAPVFTNDVQSVVASNNVNAEDQDVRFSDVWSFNLDDPNNKRQNIYALVSRGLTANRVYELHVSMYQKGVPFYNQSCKDDPKRWRCLGVTWMPIFNPQNSYFSDPLKIRFQTPNASQKNGWQKAQAIMDGVSSLGMSPLAEWVVHERPKGEQ